ncbi:hypothetical protein LAZ67_21001831, partial [Cordylochernes scorpioides]
MCLANVVFFLEGAARCWFDNVEESITTWNTFKEEFTRTFGDKEDYARRIESSLKVRAQKPDESVELYIQDVLNLCRQLNPNMSEEDRVGHLMKGVAENIYRALPAIEVTTTGEFTQHCRRIEKLNKNRISSVRFERIPTVSAINENEYHPLKEMIREIIREELRSAPNELDNLPPPQGLEDRVWQRVERNLAPIDKAPVFHSGRAVKNFRKGQQNAGEELRRKTDEFRTRENIPICFYCNRPGHVAKHCWDRRRDRDENEPSRTQNRFYYGRRRPGSIYMADFMTPHMEQSDRNNSPRRNLPRSSSPYPGRGRPMTRRRYSRSPDRTPSRSPHRDRIFEFLVHPNCSHDAILGWDFLESSKAVIDSGHSEILFSETLNEDQSAAQLHLASDEIIPPKCTKRVLTRTPSVTGIKNCAVEGARQPFLEKELFVPSSYLTIWHGQAYLWVTNFSKHPKTIPSGMCLAHLFRVQPQEVCPIIENHSNNESKSAKSPIRITNFECREENFFKVGSSEQLMRMEQISACISPELPLLHKTKLLELLENFSEVFGPIDKTTSRIITKHRINTGDAKPSKKMPYRVSPSERKVIQEEVDRMMEMGVVQPSESPWASPVVLVRKKDGSVIFCVDYRGLNKMTKKDVYPLPWVDDALDCLRGANIYSTIDLKAGYWQIGIDEADREKTAFITPDGLFEFKIMPFGLCNAPATFERMMDNLLKGLRWTICLCYLDDVVIFADNFPDHLRRLEVVLNCFKRAGLKLNPGKCSFGASNIKILGHQVDKDGIRPDNDKIKAVSQFPIPKNLQQLRSFLGLSSYYRRFIKNYADIARPLNSLLSEGTKFQWNTDQERAFQKLKNALTSKPVLGHFDDDAPTELHTDASGYGIGAVLAQKQGNGTNGRSKKIQADNSQLPRSLQERHEPSQSNDHLTIERRLQEAIEAASSTSIAIPTRDSASYSTMINHELNIPAQSGKRGPHLESVYQYLLTIPPTKTKMFFNPGISRDPGIEKKAIPNPGIENMYRDWKPYAGHLGFAKTYDIIRRRFYWPGMYRSVRKYVGHCQDCQRRKSVPQLLPGYLRPIPPTDRPFQKVGIDLLGRFPISQGKKKWIVVCTDYLTKYAVTQSLGSGGTQEIAKFLLEEVILKHGAPREIVMDRGRNFQSRLIQELTKNCHIKKKTTTAYHPQTNGLTERLNRTIADMLSMYMDLDQKNWDEMLPFITFAYNTARQESTGFTPFFLVHGREAETTLDTIFPYSSASEGEEFIQLVASRAEEARQIARHHIFKAQETNKLNYDARHKGKVYQPEDLVWIFTPIRRVGLSEKLLKRYFGPYKRSDIAGSTTLELTSRAGGGYPCEAAWARDFYSSMDLQSGYWQIDVEEADREKTAFITPDGLYEFKVMPFGLCNATATFERMMDGLLKGLKWTICLCYLDDIVVFSDDFEEHLRRLQLVLGCLRKAGLCLNSGKCRFGAKTITVLGHEVSGDGICLDPEKIRAVRDFPRPKSLKEVRSFLGLSSYYRRFIPNYAHIAQPLNALLKKDSVFSWNIEERHAFEALKSALISEPVLGHFDHSSPTEIHTDASNYGIGAVLAQIQKGKERAIAYASRTLNKAERNYSTTERECLAIIWAIGKFRPYVFGRPFTIVTDHHSLCWLTNLKDPCGRLARWALRLQEFDVTVVHKSGRKHQDADCLSRSPLNCSEDIEEDIPCIVALQNFGREQMKDPDLTKIADKIQQETSNKSFIKINDTLHKKNYDPMGREWLLVVPRHLRPEIQGNLHDSPTSGHLGFTKTYDRIRKKFYWPGMYRNVRKYVAHCPDCQRRKRQPQLPPGLLQPIPVPIAAFEKVEMDLLGRFPTSMCGNRWIIVCTDYLTKFAITKALPTSESVEVAKFFIKYVILKHGAPREVITDRGRNFTSSMIRDLNKHCRITHRTTTAYHPQTNGLTERLNKTIADMLSMYVDVNQKDWDEILPFVTFAYNTAKQESTGFSPFYLVHGREAETPLDLLFPKFPSEDEDDFIQTLGSRAEEARQLARIHTMRSQEGNKLRYDAHHRNIIYQPGVLVWIYIPVRKVGLSEKLMRRYFGPYKVTRKISEVTYEVETFGDQHGRRKTKDIVHICRMKPYLDPEKREDHLEEDMEDDLSSPQKEEVPAEGRQPPLAQEEVPRPGDLDIPGPITRSRARRLEAR